MISEQTIDTIKRTTIRGFHLNSECEDRLGSISVGKDANLNVFASNPFRTMCLKPEMVICDGVIV